MAWCTDSMKCYTSTIMANMQERPSRSKKCEGPVSEIQFLTEYKIPPLMPEIVRF